MLNLFFYFIIFLFGLTVGSFLNCIIYRLQKGESFLSKRSYCPYCKHTLSWQDLIPILSFLLLKGKCRYCQKKVSWQYPLVELAAGILLVLVIYYTYPNFLLSTFHFLITCFLIIVFVYDLKYYIIPDKIIYPAIILSLIFNTQFLFANQFKTFQYLILSAIGAALFFLIIVLISRGKWMGVGDIKLAFLMGLILGWPNIIAALFLAFFIGAIIGIGLIVTGRKRLSSEVPFGPFLVTGTLLALFLGEKLINWYSSLFLLQ